MYEEFTEREESVIGTRGYAIVNGVGRKSSDNSWSTVSKIDGKVVHQGKEQITGKQFSDEYNNIIEWLEAQEIKDQQWQ